MGIVVRAFSRRRLRVKVLSLCLRHFRRRASAPDGRRMRSSRRGPTIDLRSIALDRYRGMLSDRAWRFAAQIKMRRVHVEAHRAVERVGLIDSRLLAGKGGCREAGEEQRGCQDALSLHGIVSVDEVGGLKSSRPLSQNPGRAPPLRSLCLQEKIPEIRRMA